MTAEFDLIRSPISGNNIIEASAGTGKTYSIEGLYVRALLLPFLEQDSRREQTISVGNILVVTYTEAAIAELRIRICEKLRRTLNGFKTIKKQQLKPGSIDKKQLLSELEAPDDPFINDLVLFAMPLIENSSECTDRIINQLKLAFLSFDEAAIFTIHGFCKRMLSDYALEAQSGFDFEFTTNQSQMIEECVSDFWRNQVYQADSQYADFFLSFFKTPSEITSYFTAVINKPYSDLLPAAGRLDKDWFAALMKQYRQLQKEWANDKSEIRALIDENEEGIYKNYRKDVAKLFNHMDQFFSQSVPTGLPAIAKNLTPLVIRKMTKTQYESITHSFFDTFEPFYHTMAHLKEHLVADCIPILTDDFRRRKERINLLSFDDLLINLNEALNQQSGNELTDKIRKRFQLALIDEFQDTDPIQYEIFHHLFYNHIPLFLIGDPKQSIYNFRGADIFAYFKAVRDGGTKTHLTTNWRSCQDLVKAFNAIFSEVGAHDQFVFKDKIQYTDSAGTPSKPDRSLIVEGRKPAPFQFWFHKADDPIASADIRTQILQATVAEIVRLLNLGVEGHAGFETGDPLTPFQPVEPKDIAILVSSHRQATMFQNALRAKNVPSVQKGTGNIFETKEFYEIKCLLKAVAEYHHEASLKPVFVTDLYDYQGDELLALFENEEQWERVVDEFQRLNKTWHKKGLFAMFRQFMTRQTIRERLLSFEGGERKLSNFIQICEILHRVQVEDQLDNPGLIQWMEMIVHSPQDYEDNEIRLETDDDALSILTIHSSKGLQFPIVFCPYAWSTGKRTSEVMFHDPEHSDRLTWDLTGQDQNKKKAKLERLAEQIRLTYVAFTRAEYCCYTAWGKINRYGDSCYNHLFHKGFKGQKGGYDKIPIDVFRQDLLDLQKRSDHTIAVTELPAGSSKPFRPNPIQDPDLVVRVIDKSPQPASGIFSFTSLTQKEGDHPVEADDHDIGEEDQTEPTDLEKSPLSLLSFPGGITTGNLFHDILEHVDFQSADLPSEMVITKLKNYGFAEERGPLILDLIGYLRTLLITSDYTGEEPFSFSMITPDQMVREMPFYFVLNQVALAKTIEITQSSGSTPLHTALLDNLKFIPHDSINGFMKGFMDMVFCYQGRYYILDWKTNILGTQLEDYSADRIRNKINEYHYNLQYLIYSVALHQYLKQRIPDYDYGRHFGGVFYVFIRGIQDDTGQYGIYYESLAPFRELIESLESLFRGAPHV